MPNTIDAFNINKFDKNRNYVIEASAGTGKTYSIVEIVKKITEGDINEIKKVLIVTYTEKAAGELKDRIAAGLREKFPDEIDKLDLNDISIYTIHSFCKNTIKEFGITSNLPLDLDLISDLDLDDFTEKYFRTGEIYKTIIALWELGTGIKVDGIKETFIDGIKKYYLDSNGEEDESIVSLEVKKKNIDYKKGLERIIKLSSYKDFNDYLDHDPEAKHHYEVLKNSTSSQANYCAEQLESTFKDRFYGGRPVKNGNTKGRDNISGKSKENESKAVEYFAEIVDSMGTNSAECKDGKYAKRLVSALYFVDYFKAWQKEKEYKKSQSFDDMIRYIREEVKKPGSELLTKLRQKYTYGIIDEFQDTNQRQFDIFKSIFLDGENNHIIVVGDPKQSIYAFQGADVNVYNDAKEKIEEKGKICSLVKNWRSSNGMVDFANKFFDESNDFNFEVTKFTKSDPNDNFRSTFDGKDAKSIWIGSEGPNGGMVDEREFARISVEQILKCCKKDDKGNTALQLYSKDKKGVETVRGVDFSDFTVLARTRSEMSAIKSELKRVGIPFIQYKDDSLFKGKECANWISILQAVNLPDYTGNNRKIFKKALFTVFFGFDLYELNDERFDKEDIDEIKLFNEWRELAKKRLWEDLIDSIMVKSNLFSVLKALNKSQTFNKIRQLGEYIVDYLYENHTLIDVIRNLSNLSKGTDEDEEGATVGRGTDFKAVKIMTMHASKGLEFPVVISVGGHIGVNKKLGKAFTYHQTYKDSNQKTLKKLILTLSKDNNNSKDIYKEVFEEYKRIYYVAYTRAKYVLILPNYQGNYSDDGFTFLRTAMEKYMSNYPDDFDYVYKSKKKLYELQDETKEILNSENKNDRSTTQEIEDQKQALVKLSGEVKGIQSYKRSYSSLSHPKHENDDEFDEEEINLEGEKGEGLKEFDEAGIPIDGEYDETAITKESPKKFPKGAKIGTALHEIFEKLDYQNYESMVDEVIKNAFEGQLISLSDEAKIYVKDMVYRVLNAKFPEIHGAEKTNKFFDLKVLSLKDKKAEKEFNFNLIFGDKAEFLKNYFNGFIDLFFKIGDYYSVLDWKSDTLSDTFKSYKTLDDLKAHVDDAYSIQRVLYAYCIIKWLKTYYPSESEEDIFKNHFGGVYYVFVRGCNPGTSNGVYAHTWKSWADLESAFENIINKRIWRKK